MAKVLSRRSRQRLRSFGEGEEWALCGMGSPTGRYENQNQ